MSRPPRFGPGTRPTVLPRYHCGGCGATTSRLGIDPHGEACICPSCESYDLRPVPPSDPVRDALVLAAGEVRGVLVWGDRVKPRGWKHIRENLDGLRVAVDDALAAMGE